METIDSNMILLLGEFILIAVLLIIGFVILWYIIQVQRRLDTLIAITQRQRPAPAMKPAEAGPSIKEDVNQNVAATPYCNHIVDVLEDRTDIRKNMESLGKKYGLESITLSSPDGLVIASSDPDASEIAAQYSHKVRLGIKPEDSRVQVFEMHYRGSPLIGIIRSDRPLPAGWLSPLEEDVKKILNWWLS
jgi:hypothetical protein